MMLMAKGMRVASSRLARLIALSLTVVTPTTRQADAADTLNLVCTYSSTVDEVGKASPTSGRKAVQITILAGNAIHLRQEGLGAVYTGTISDAEIAATTQYSIGGSVHTRELWINRYSGNFSESFKIGASGIVHYGSCAPASRQF